MVVRAGKLLSLSDMENLQRLFREEVKPQAIGGRKGLLLTGDAEDEEIVFAL